MKNNIFFIIILFIFFILFSLFVYFAKGKPYFTSYLSVAPGRISGKNWHKLSDIDKSMYLAGYYEDDNIFPGIGNIYRERAVEELKSKSEILKDLKFGLDQFYSDPANKKIPVSQARDFVLRKIRGVRVDPEQKIQKDIEEARSKFQ